MHKRELHHCITHEVPESVPLGLRFNRFDCVPVGLGSSGAGVLRGREFSSTTLEAWEEEISMEVAIASPDRPVREPFEPTYERRMELERPVFALELAVLELRRLSPPAFCVELDSDDGSLAWSPPARGVVGADDDRAAPSEMDVLLRLLRHAVMKEVGGDAGLDGTCAPPDAGPDARFATDTLRPRGSSVGEVAPWRCVCSAFARTCCSASQIEGASAMQREWQIRKQLGQNWALFRTAAQHTRQSTATVMLC